MAKNEAKKVLLIEDIPVVQYLYSENLKDNGFSVEIVANVKSALDKVKDTIYDFILVDLLLPDVNGIEFLEKFNNRPPQTKVIILSDFDEPKTVDRAYQLGITDYLIKAENTPSELVEKLKKLN